MTVYEIGGQNGDSPGYLTNFAYHGLYTYTLELWQCIHDINKYFFDPNDDTDQNIMICHNGMSYLVLSSLYLPFIVN